MTEGQIWNDQVKELTEAAGDAGVSLHTCESHVHWFTDGEILAMILFNLLMNAVAYSSCEAEVTMAMESRPDGIRLLVRDTGKGLAAEMKGRLFDEGTTTSSEGGGFGLYYSRVRARDLGGDLKYDQDWTAGAGFVLTLPRLSRI